MPQDDMLIDIQTQLMYQEDLVQALNDAVALQQQDILLLQAQLADMREEFRELLRGVDGQHGSVPDQPPPHY